MRSALNKVKQKTKLQTSIIPKSIPPSINSNVQKEFRENCTQTLEPFITKKSSDNDTSKEFDCDLNTIQQHISSIATATEKEYKYGSSSPKCTCLKKSQKGSSSNNQSDSRIINWRELSNKIKDLEEQIVEISMRYQKRETNLINELEQKRLKWIVKYHELKQDAENMKEFYEKGKSVWKFYLSTIHEALTSLQFFQQEQSAKNISALQQVMTEINEINNLVISNHYSGAANAKTTLNESQFQYTNRFDSQPTSCSRNLDQTTNQQSSHHQFSHIHHNSHHQLNPNPSTANLSQICSKINSAIKKTEDISSNMDGLMNIKKTNKVWTQQQIQIMERIELLLRQNQKISFISSTPEQSSMVGTGQDGSSIKKSSFIQQQQQSNILNQIIKNNIQVQDSQSKYKTKKDSSSPKRNDFLKLAAQFSPRTLRHEIDGSYQFKVSNIEDDDELDRKSESTQKEFILNDESLNQEVQKRKSFSSQKKQEIEQRYSRDLCIIRRLFHDVSNSLHLSEQFSNGYLNKYEDTSMIKNSVSIGDDALILQSQNLQNGLQTPLKSNQKSQNNNNNINSSTSYILKNNQLIQSVQSMIVPSFYTMSDAKSHLQTQRILNNIQTLQKSDIDNNNLTYSQDEDGSIQNYSNLIYSRKSNGANIPQYDSIFANPIIQSDNKQVNKMDDKVGSGFQTSLKGLKTKTIQIDNFNTNYNNTNNNNDDSRSELTIKEDYSMSSQYKNSNKHYF